MYITHIFSHLEFPFQKRVTKRFSNDGLAGEEHHGTKNKTGRKEYKTHIFGHFEVSRRIFCDATEKYAQVSLGVCVLCL